MNRQNFPYWYPANSWGRGSEFTRICILVWNDTEGFRWTVPVDGKRTGKAYLNLLRTLLCLPFFKRMVMRNCTLHLCASPPSPRITGRFSRPNRKELFHMKRKCLSCSNAHLILTHLDLHLWDVWRMRCIVQSQQRWKSYGKELKCGMFSFPVHTVLGSCYAVVRHK